MSSYKLNAKLAKEGDKGGNQRITETGAYTGVFTSVREAISKKKTIGVEFAFKADNGAEARFVSLWITRADGENLGDYNKLMAVMACMKVKDTKKRAMPITEYDFSAGEVITHTVDCYPELMNKPIGVVFQKEEYIKTKDGSVGSSMRLYAAFNAETKQTAIELLDNSPAERLEKILEVVKDKLVDKGQAYQAEQNASAGAPTVVDNDVDDLDDDIPF